MPIVALHETKYHRKAKSGALTGFLGGKEWFENVFELVSWNSVAVVTDADKHILPGRESGTGSAEFAVKFGIAGLDRQQPAFGHGIRGIGRQVQQRVLELARIYFHRPKYWIQVDTKFDRGSDRACN